MLLTHSLFGVFETGFLCVALEPILALTLETRMESYSQRSACLCFPSAVIKGMHLQILAGTLFRTNLSHINFTAIFSI